MKTPMFNYSWRDIVIFMYERDRVSALYGAIVDRLVLSKNTSYLCFIFAR